MAGKEIIVEPTVKNRGLQAAASQSTNGAAIIDNRTTSLVQRKQLGAFAGKNTVLQKKGSDSAENGKGVIQAKWRDEFGIDHAGNPPKGYVMMNNNVIGEHWIRGGESESEEFSESHDENESSEYELDPEEEKYIAKDPEEKFKGKSGEYRSGRKFYKDKERDTRKNLGKRQRSPGGRLYSGFHGDGEEIVLDEYGREIREHKKKGTKHKQPDIDHIRDWVILDDAIDRYEHEESSMSEAEKETFKDEVYNYEDNLEILSKKEHKKKRKTTRDKITEPEKKDGTEFIKERRAEFKKDKKAEKRRNRRRERLKRKKERKKKEDKDQKK